MEADFGSGTSPNPPEPPAPTPLPCQQRSIPYPSDLAPIPSKRKLIFEYDSNSRRIGKKVYVWNGTAYPGSPNSTLKFVYDGWNLLAELDGGNAVVRSYQWGTDLSGSSKGDIGGGGVGGLLSMKPSSGIAQFASCDGNGNLVALVDGVSGEVTAAYEYGPFGESIRTSGSQSINPFRFSSKYQDIETGLLCYGYRFYNVALGKWVSRDKIDEMGGVNLYAFNLNDSINKIDPVGLAACGTCGRDVTALVGSTLNDMSATFHGASQYTRIMACSSLLNPLVAGNSWDIGYLKPWSCKENLDAGASECGDMVTYKGKCVRPNELNYVFFGRAVSLCSKMLSMSSGILDIYPAYYVSPFTSRPFMINAFRGLLYGRSLVTGESLESMANKMSFINNEAYGTPLPNSVSYRSECRPSSTPARIYANNSNYTPCGGAVRSWKWEYLHDGIGAGGR